MEETLQSLREQAVLFLPTLVAGVVIFIGFWIASKVLRGVVHRVGRAANVPPEVVHLIKDIAGLLTLGFGIITALGTLGINVAAMVAGLGLTGFALGFALHDAIASTLAGILILVYQPFKVGERIRVGDKEGIVADINLRYTTLRGEGQRILIPNQNLFKEAITVTDSAARVRDRARGDTEQSAPRQEKAT